MKLVTGITAVAAACLVVAGGATSRGERELRWRQVAPLAGAVDLAGPRNDGRLVVAARAGLFLRTPKGSMTRFSIGASGYVPARGEAYLVLTHTHAVRGARCSFGRDDVYALDPIDKPGVVLITRAGRARRFADLPAGSFLSGIAADTVGRFGYRLLVTSVTGAETTLYAIDCRGRTRVVARGAVKVEGGMTVAPRTFGRFGGWLIAPDESTGSIYAIGPKGQVRLVVRPALASGADIGIESLGFVSKGLSSGSGAYLADYDAPGSPTAGTNSLLRLSVGGLVRAGVRAGDLLAVTEAGGVTVAVRCATRCTTRRIARALDATHAEGHVVFGDR